MQKIEDAVADVLDAMRKRGIGDYSIKCINWSVYHPIINWHHERGAEVCSFELLESLCAYQQKRYESGEISRKFYRSFVTAAFRIQSYVSTGEVDFSIVKDTKWYRPGKEYQAHMDLILEGTGLKEKNESFSEIRKLCVLQYSVYLWYGPTGNHRSDTEEYLKLETECCERTKVILAKIEQVTIQLREYLEKLEVVEGTQNG